MADSGTGERTEKATGKRRDEAREKGTVPKSQEVSSAVVLIAGMTLLVASSGFMANKICETTGYMLGQAHILGPINVYAASELIEGSFWPIAGALAPLIIGILIASVWGNVAQFGFKFTPKAMSLQFDRMNPVSGMQKFFKMTAFFELGKNFLKIVLVSILAWTTISGLMDTIVGSSLLSLPAVVATGKAAFIKVVAKLLAFCAVLALGDWFWQKWRYEENLKMSKYEVKQEAKDYDGDPQIKARIRGMQYEMFRKRMIAAVPTADVVVTNPTHFAVALKYEPGSPAPKVVAKGQDHLAGIIRKLARENRVPVIENKPLARALHAQVEVGHYVPESLFQAVAEVLAYVYRLKRS
ncbi:MAG: flagellar biosynthesis protein FlhB [bacterium]|nr:flagellar biosynthesis protein FlhB [bacterium]